MKPTPSRMHVCDLNQYWDFKLRKVESIQMMENTVPSVSHKPSEVNLCITHNLLGTMLVICSFGEWPKKSHLFVVVLTPIILIKKKVWIWGQPSTCIQGWRGSTTPLTLWWKQYFKKKQREAGLNQQQSVFGGLAFTSKLGVGRSQNWHDNHVSLS